MDNSAVFSNTKPTELRRSCVFCRQRKMRCSGDLPCCTTCRQREKPCVYEPVAFKGRYASSSSMPPSRNGVPSSKQQSVKSSDETTSAGQLDVTKAESAALYTLSGESSKFAPLMGQLRGGEEMIMEPTTVTSFSSPHGCLIGDELLFYFNAFGGLVQQSMALQRLYSQGHDNATPPNSPLRYIDTLPIITKDIVERTVKHLGPSMVKKQDDHADNLLVRHLVADRAVSITDGLDEPAAEQYFAVHGPPSAVQIEQLVELAYSRHPFLSLIVPKTPFVRDQQEGQPNHCLLWLLCGEGMELGVPASGMVPNTPLAFTLPRPAAFFQLAWKALFNSQPSTLADRLWISQALLLLSLRLICLGQIRQATACLLSCVRSVTRLLHERNRQPIMEVKINGVRMSEVDNQAARNIYWLVHAMLLWMWHHVDEVDSELAKFILPEAPALVPLPSTVLGNDPIYTLDYVSANFTSLQHLEANARTLCVLAYVVTVSHALLRPSGSDHGFKFAHSMDAYGFDDSTSTLRLGSASNTPRWDEQAELDAHALKLVLRIVQSFASTPHVDLHDHHAQRAILACAHLLAIVSCSVPNERHKLGSAQGFDALDPFSASSENKVGSAKILAALRSAQQMLRDCQTTERPLHQLSIPVEDTITCSFLFQAAVAMGKIRELWRVEMGSCMRGYFHAYGQEGMGPLDGEPMTDPTGKEIDEVVRQLLDASLGDCRDGLQPSNRQSIRSDGLAALLTSKAQMIMAHSNGAGATMTTVTSSTSSSQIDGQYNAVRASFVHQMNDCGSYSISSDAKADGLAHVASFHSPPSADYASVDMTMGHSTQRESADEEAQRQEQMASASLRARSLSESMAIYCPTASTAPAADSMSMLSSGGQTGNNAVHHANHASGFASFTSAGVAAGAQVTTSGLDTGTTHSHTSENGVLNAFAHYAAARRHRTYSVDELHASHPLAVSMASHLPPSPPLSVPSDQVALLCNADASLQAILHGYQMSSPPSQVTTTQASNTLATDQGSREPTLDPMPSSYNSLPNLHQQYGGHGQPGADPHATLTHPGLHRSYSWTVNKTDGDVGDGSLAQQPPQRRTEAGTGQA